jgi:membrane associated rhomboid family serine protease
MAVHFRSPVASRTGQRTPPRLVFDEDSSGMLYNEQSEDYRPLFWVSGRPVYAYTLLIIGHIVAFVAAAICISFFGLFAVQEFLVLDTDRIIHQGEIWRLATYIVFLPSLWFIFAMGFLYFAGQQVEQFIGYKTFLKLYAALVLIPAVVLCLVGLLWPQATIGGTESIFGVFVAFATIYPGLVLNIWFVNLTTKGWAWVLLGVYSLIDFSNHAWSSLLILWLCAAVGYLGMRLMGAGRGMTWLTDWIEDRQAKRLARKRNFKVLKDAQAAESIDDILEKISKSGVGSLNPSERAALERARTNLLKRDQR